MEVGPFFFEFCIALEVVSKILSFVATKGGMSLGRRLAYLLARKIEG